MSIDTAHEAPPDHTPRTAPTPPSVPGRFRRWTAHHPVAAFMTIAFSVAYPVMALPVMASHGVIPDGWMPQTAGVDPERIASVLLVLVALLPASVWVTWATEGRPGVHQLARRMLRWRIGFVWTVVVLAAIPTLTLAFALLLGDSLRTVDVVALSVGQTIGLLVNLALINIWEETAWSGVVQTRLERRHGLVRRHCSPPCRSHSSTCHCTSSGTSPSDHS